MALAKTTQDHDEIRKWAEERGGKPAVVAATEGENETGIIRLMFPNAPNHNDDALEEISWEEFFEKFDSSGLQLTYQEETADGQKSDFNKLVYPEPDSPEGKRLLRKTASKKGGKSAGSKKAAGSAKAAGGTKSAGKKSTAKVAAKKAPAKKASAKAGVAKKVAAKAAPAKKTAGKKAPAKKTTRR